MKLRELLLVAVSLVFVAQEGAYAQSFGGPGRGGPGFAPPPPNQPIQPPGMVPVPGDGYRDDYGRGGWGRGGWRRGRHRPPHHGYPGHRPIDPYRAQLVVDALYTAFLFRRVDPQSLNHAVFQIQSGGVQAIYQLAQQIGMSPEFNQRILHFYRPEQIVGNAFSVLFRRGPDQSAHYYIQLFYQGRSIEAMVAMVQSQDFSYNYLY